MRRPELRYFERLEEAPFAHGPGPGRPGLELHSLAISDVGHQISEWRMDQSKGALSRHPSSWLAFFAKGVGCSSSSELLEGHQVFRVMRDVKVSFFRTLCPDIQPTRPNAFLPMSGPESWSPNVAVSQTPFPPSLLEESLHSKRWPPPVRRCEVPIHLQHETPVEVGGGPRGAPVCGGLEVVPQSSRESSI